MAIGLYRVIHLLADWVGVTLILDVPMSCLGSTAAAVQPNGLRNIPNPSQPNPGSRADGLPCTSFNSHVCVEEALVGDDVLLGVEVGVVEHLSEPGAALVPGHEARHWVGLVGAADVAGRGAERHELGDAEPLVDGGEVPVLVEKMDESVMVYDTLLSPTIMGDDTLLSPTIMVLRRPR